MYLYPYKTTQQFPAGDHKFWSLAQQDGPAAFGDSKWYLIRHFLQALITSENAATPCRISAVMQYLAQINALLEASLSLPRSQFDSLIRINGCQIIIINEAADLDCFQFLSFSFFA